MSLKSYLQETYQNRLVLVTGHTGFKGSWLCAWLKLLGAKVIGVSLPLPDSKILFGEACIADKMTSIYQDVCNYAAVQKVFNETQPEIVFHLASQSSVRLSYADPLTTYKTNVMGMTNVLEAARHCSSVKSVVIVTGDKCYQNREWEWGYRETDALGGKDPFAASKACMELVTASYQEGLFPLSEFPVRVASARGGTVLGGGSWSEDRLVPGLIESLRLNKTITLRNPSATRSWQHVLELLQGHLILGAKLSAENGEKFACPWNLAPVNKNAITVHLLAKQLAALWESNADIQVISNTLPEPGFLHVDASKAEAILGWHSKLSIEKSLMLTVKWYKEYYNNPTAAGKLLNNQILDYQELMA